MPKATRYGVLEDGDDNPFGEMNEHTGIPDGPIALQMSSGEIIRPSVRNTLRITWKPRKNTITVCDTQWATQKGDTDVDADDDVCVWECV